jgi:hypothetical protein
VEPEMAAMAGSLKDGMLSDTFWAGDQLGAG